MLEPEECLVIDEAPAIGAPNEALQAVDDIVIPAFHDLVYLHFLSR